MEKQLAIDFTDRKAPILTDEERRVVALVSFRMGKDCAILGAGIAEAAGIDYTTVRAIIAHLVNNHGCLIASCARGYYTPQTDEEITEATRSLRHRGIMILMRAARLQKSSLEDIYHQAKLELEKAS